MELPVFQSMFLLRKGATQQMLNCWYWVVQYHGPPQHFVVSLSINVGPVPGKVLQTNRDLSRLDLEKDLFYSVQLFTIFVEAFQQHVKRCLEKVKHILPSGCLMVIYHGKK